MTGDAATRAASTITEEFVMARRNKFGRTAAQQKVVDGIRERGGVVPIGLFDLSMTPEEVQRHQEIKRASATSPHGNQRARLNGTGRTSRVGSRSSAKKAAIRDF